MVEKLAETLRSFNSKIPASEQQQILDREQDLVTFQHAGWDAAWHQLTEPQKSEIDAVPRLDLQLFCEAAQEILNWAKTDLKSPQARISAAMVVTKHLVDLILPSFQIKEVAEYVPELKALEQAIADIFNEAITPMPLHQHLEACVVAENNTHGKGQLAAIAGQWLSRPEFFKERTWCVYEN